MLAIQHTPAGPPGMAISETISLVAFCFALLTQVHSRYVDEKWRCWKMAPKKISDTGEDEDMKWITLRMAQSHIEELDNQRQQLNDEHGLHVSRSAYVRSIILKALNAGFSSDAVEVG